MIIAGRPLSLFRTHPNGERLKWMFPEPTLQPAASKIELQARRQRSFPRQFVIEIERVQPVILIGDIQQAEANFRDPIGKAVAGKQVQLPEIVARNIRGVAAVRLNQPERVELAEETAAEM